MDICLVCAEKALQSVEDAAYERAAQIAEFKPTIGGNDENGCCRYSVDLIAQAIRNLKNTGGKA